MAITYRGDVPHRLGDKKCFNKSFEKHVKRYYMNMLKGRKLKVTPLCKAQRGP